jgi:hypothetical protein
MSTEYPNPPVVNVTTNHSIFKKLHFNRELDRTNLNKLLRETAKKFQMHKFPILVDSDYSVIDGQHRLEVCRQLETPIYFIVDASNDSSCNSVRSVNVAGRSHSLTDKIQMAIKNNNKESLIVKSVFLEFEGVFRINLVARLLGCFQSGGSVSEQFDNETYKVNYLNETKRLFTALINAKNIENKERERVVTAVAQVVRLSPLSTSKTIERIDNNWFKFVTTGRRKELVRQMVDAFNYKLSEINRIKI